MQNGDFRAENRKDSGARYRYRERLRKRMFAQQQVIRSHYRSTTTAANTIRWRDP